MKYRTIIIENGGFVEPYKIYTCAICGKDVEEAWPKEIIGEEVYCGVTLCVECHKRVHKEKNNEWLYKG